MRTGQTVLLAVFLALTVFAVWFGFRREETDGEELPKSPEAAATSTEAVSPRGRDLLHRSAPAGVPSVGEGRMRRSAPPDSSESQIASRARLILDAYRARRVPRFLHALIRPHPTQSSIREAFRITSGFTAEEQAAAIEAFRRHPSAKLKEILESIASSDSNPEVRNLAQRVLDAFPDETR